MSLARLANVCSHLQNTSKARLGCAMVPFSKLHLAIALGLQDAGFISSVTRGSIDGPDKEYTPVTQDNVAKRALWLGMKYYDNEPVLSKMHLVSKPKQRVWMGVAGLQELSAGRKFNYVEGVQPGECIFLGSDRGIFEIREAIERRIGGEVLCRVS